MKGLMLAVLCALALLVPVAAADAATASSNKGRVTVGAKITRFAVVDRKIVARGVLTTRVTGAGQSQAARTPVTFAVVAQSGRCSVLTLRLQGLDLTLLGLNVNLSEVNLRIYAIRRGEGSGILGRLFCALSRSQLRLGRGASVAQA
jgi:opacity protein-like surface antigen